MKSKRPSASLIVAIIALVVATAGTATAASRYLITSSSQVKTGAINGTDIQNGSIKGGDIANGTITSSKLAASARLSASSGDSFATEAVRKNGPVVNPGGSQRVATLSALQPGTYVLQAKTTMSMSSNSDLGLGELLNQQKTVGAHCILDASGDQDDARAPIAVPYTKVPTTLYMQLTRTLGSAADISLLCDAPAGWEAHDTSIIAIRVGGTARSDVTG